MVTILLFSKFHLVSIRERWFSPHIPICHKLFKLWTRQRSHVSVLVSIFVWNPPGILQTISTEANCSPISMTLSLFYIYHLLLWPFIAEECLWTLLYFLVLNLTFSYGSQTTFFITLKPTQKLYFYKNLILYLRLLSFVLQKFFQM